MTEPYLFRASATEWRDHPTLPGIRIQALQDSTASPPASVSVVQVEPDGEIIPHFHADRHETAIILSGTAVLTLPSGDHLLSPGDGVTVPPGVTHSLRNNSREPVRILAFHMPPLF